MIIWNPWHGCHKVSEGCEHCYMYFLDSKRGLDTSNVFRTENFTMPIQRRRDGQFKLVSGMTLYVGLSTDFFVEEADQWRAYYSPASRHILSTANETTTTFCGLFTKGLGRWLR